MELVNRGGKKRNIKKTNREDEHGFCNFTPNNINFIAWRKM